MKASKEPIDCEKGFGEKDVGNVEVVPGSLNEDALPMHVPEKLSRWNRTVQSLSGLEARGISRVQPTEREVPTLAALVQMALMWYSANITLNNLAVGFLGPLLFELGFLDSALIVVFACFLGSIGPAYMAIWGPQSGNRTMVYPLSVEGSTEVDKGLGRCALLYGLLAGQTDHCAEPHHHGRLRDNQLYYRWPSSVSRERRNDVGGSWHCAHRFNMLGYRCVWNEAVPYLREVSQVPLPSTAESGNLDTQYVRTMSERLEGAYRALGTNQYRKPLFSSSW